MLDITTLNHNEWRLNILTARCNSLTTYDYILDIFGTYTFDGIFYDVLL